MQSKKQILFVCGGNSCRSPMAEALYNGLFPKSKFEAFSRGAHRWPHRTIAEGTLTTLMDFDWDIAKSVLRHVPTEVDEEDIERAEIIFTMDRLQSRGLAKSGAPKEKIFTMHEYAELEPAVKPVVESEELRGDIRENGPRFGSIPDPFRPGNKGHRLYHDCRETMINLLEKINSRLEATHHEGFEHHRKASLAYLTDVDSRGWIGWEKVDPMIQDIVHNIHRIPSLFHYGESCSGHVKDLRTMGPMISHGYLSIGSDKSPEAENVIDDLRNVVASSNISTAVEFRAPHYQGGKAVANVDIYSIRVSGEQVRGLAKLGRLRRHFEKSYRPFWQGVHEVLEDHAKDYGPLWDRNETAHQKPDRSAEFLQEQRPFAA